MTEEVLDQEEDGVPAVQANPWTAALRLLTGTPNQTQPLARQPHRLYWMLGPAESGNGYRLTVNKGRSDGSGRLPQQREVWVQFDQALSRPMKYLDEDDLAALRLLMASRVPGERARQVLPLSGRQGYEALQRLLESSRLHADVTPPVALRSGADRAARLIWRQDAAGRFRAHAEATPPIAWALPLEPPAYVDAESGEVGRLIFELPDGVASQLLGAAPLTEAEARQTALSLADTAPGAAPRLQGPVAEIDAEPHPVLDLTTFIAPALLELRNYPLHQWRTALDAAAAYFRYDDVLIPAHNAGDFAYRPNGELVRIHRRREAEAACLLALHSAGFESIPVGAVQYPQGSDLESQGLLVLEDESAWAGFMADTRPRLEAAGWQIIIPGDFRHHALEVESWEADISEAESGWFDVDMGIVVEGRRLALPPLLAELFQRDARWLDGFSLANIAPGERIDLHTPEGRRIRVPAERLKPLARTLIDLFDGAMGAAYGGRLRVSKLDAPRLARLDRSHWNTSGLDAVQLAARQMESLVDMQPVPPPAGLALTLRPYQLDGLAWLQHLRSHKLAGILADDMGLGKTAQALAHLLVEKESGRLGGKNGPALIILPTSLVFNWKTESARFAPGLSVLSLQGKER